jgi:hypothetical protein
VAATSALTGPGTTAQISAMMSVNFLPVFATRDGLVVTPSSSPLEASDLISAVSAVSTKNFMLASVGRCRIARIRKGGSHGFIQPG